MVKLQMSQRALGGYELLCPISSRPGSKVYLARRPGAERARLFSVKVVPMGQSPDSEQELLREAKVLQRLRHPSCIAVEDVGGEAGALFMVSPYVFGLTLRELLNQARESGEPLPLDLGAVILRDVATGLHFAHGLTDDAGDPLGLVHRDVTPENVMVSFEGEVKVLDFGSVNIADDSPTKTGVIKGKAAYMAPEQITGRRIDRRTDVYALGVILHEMIANEPLFGGLSPQEIIFRQYRDPPPPIETIAPDIEPALAEICNRALAPDPLERFPSAQALAEALRQVAGLPPRSEEQRKLKAMLRERFEETYQERAQQLQRWIQEEPAEEEPPASEDATEPVRMPGVSAPTAPTRIPNAVTQENPTWLDRPRVKQTVRLIPEPASSEAVDRSDTLSVPAWDKTQPAASAEAQAVAERRVREMEKGRWFNSRGLIAIIGIIVGVAIGLFAARLLEL